MDSNDVIPRLKFIAKLNKGDKIYVKQLHIQPNNLLYRILRSFYYVDDRANALTFVHTTIRSGFEILHAHLAEDSPFHSKLCQNLIHDLHQAKEGLRNLKETYSEDVMFSCKIDALIEDTEAKLLALEKEEKKEAPKPVRK